MSITTSAPTLTQPTAAEAARFEIRTTRYGELETIEIAETDVIEFPEGLPGFERHQRFAMIVDQKLAPFCWLQSLHDPLVGFLVIEPGLLVTDYSFDIADPDSELLQITNSAEARVLSILVVPEDVRAMTANLQAPLILNPEKRIAKQVILTDERFPLRYPVFGGPGTVGRSPGRRRAC
jgi:flagellar assembly factor FliW